MRRRRIAILRCVQTVACFTAALMTSSWTIAEPAPSRNAPAVDGSLGGVLESDLFEGLGDLQLPPGADDAPQPPSTAPSADDPVPRPEPQGEDLGAAGESTLARLGSMMREVEERFASQDSSSKNQQLQEDLLSQLRAALETQKKKCDACSGGTCPNPSAGLGQAKTASSGTKPSSKPGENPSPSMPAAQGTASDPQGSQTVASSPTDSVERLEQGRLEEILRTSAADFDELWGQLPPNVQLHLKQGLSERTLPQYEKMIEAYYRRLAEESAGAK